MGVNQEESEQNEVDGTKKGADSTGEVMHMYVKEQHCGHDLGLSRLSIPWLLAPESFRTQRDAADLAMIRLTCLHRKGCC